jgi:hypothetical protein
MPQTLEFYLPLQIQLGMALLNQITKPHAFPLLFFEQQLQLCRAGMQYKVVIPRSQPQQILAVCCLIWLIRPAAFCLVNRFRFTA